MLLHHLFKALYWCKTPWEHQEWAVTSTYVTCPPPRSVWTQWCMFICYHSLLQTRRESSRPLQGVINMLSHTGESTPFIQHQSYVSLYKKAPWYCKKTFSFTEAWLSSCPLHFLCLLLYHPTLMLKWIPAWHPLLLLWGWYMALPMQHWWQQTNMSGIWSIVFILSPKLLAWEYIQ